MSQAMKSQKIVDEGVAPLVEMERICKNFGEVCALDHVSFKLKPGEIRALVGENGAGKTTLMNILYGIYYPDGGNILLNGVKVTEKWSPRDAIDHGISMIHQHFSLIYNHTVIENIVMPMLRWGDILPPWGKLEEEVRQLCQEYHFEIDLKKRIENMSMGERQQVEILKSLYQGTRVLILDEPTSVLTPQQTESLLQFLLELKKRGHSVVIVTHKLDEAMAVSDQITVLRGGKHIGTIKTEEATPQKIARMMVERDWITSLEVNKPPENSRVLLETRGLTVKNRQGMTLIDDISFQVKAGEIVGVAGVAGNGQVELAEALVGLQKISQGSIMIDGKEATRWGVARRRRAGLSYIPEDRHTRGIVLEMSVADNIVIEAIDQPPFSKMGVINPKEITECANQLIKNFKIKTPDGCIPAGHLSGGNQQKIVLARALIMNPKVIIACQPTRGLDFSATEYIRRKLLESAKQGLGILMISSDLDEILELSNRIMVLFKGRKVGEFLREEVDIGQLGLLMAGHIH